MAKKAAQKVVKRAAKTIVKNERAQQAFLQVERIALPKEQAAITVIAQQRSEDGNWEAAGRLLVSRGGVKWYPVNGKKKVSMSWAKFGRHMESAL